MRSSMRPDVTPTYVRATVTPSSPRAVHAPSRYIHAVAGWPPAALLVAFVTGPAAVGAAAPAAVAPEQRPRVYCSASGRACSMAGDLFSVVLGRMAVVGSCLVGRPDQSAVWAAKARPASASATGGLNSASLGEGCSVVVVVVAAVATARRPVARARMQLPRPPMQALGATKGRVAAVAAPKVDTPRRAPGCSWRTARQYEQTSPERSLPPTWASPRK